MERLLKLRERRDAKIVRRLDVAIYAMRPGVKREDLPTRRRDLLQTLRDNASGEGWLEKGFVNRSIKRKRKAIERHEAKQAQGVSK